MAHVSSFPSFTLPVWRLRPRTAVVAARVPAAPSHPVCAARLGGFVSSLWRVCDRATVATEARQQLRFSCVVNGEPPVPQLNTVIRLATFLLADAAGAEATCRIGVLVERHAQQVVLSVEHDGWPQLRAVDGGRNLAWARCIAEASGGELSRQLDWDRTVTRVTLPDPRRPST